MKTARPIYLIAEEIRKEWKPVHGDALPYLRAMLQLVEITDTYGSDSAKGIILYFLGNANTWKGEAARRIKKELNQLVS